MTGVKFGRRRESQKTIVTIEFTTLTLRRVRSFIKIEAFVVLRAKLWPNRWQLPTLTGVNIDRHQKLQKLLSPLNSPPSICSEYVTSSKLKHLPFFVQNFGLEDDRWGVKNHRKLLSSVNSAPSNCSLCKILWKMVNLIPRFPFPISHSPFPFLKTASYF